MALCERKVKDNFTFRSEDAMNQNKKYKFATCFVWVRKVVSYFEGRT
jgi:hypothetical protein